MSILHFALVFAQAFINTNTVPTQELCERWLAEGYVNEEELEMILIHKSSKHISTSSSIVGSVLSVIALPPVWLIAPCSAPASAL